MNTDTITTHTFQFKRVYLLLKKDCIFLKATLITLFSTMGVILLLWNIYSINNQPTAFMIMLFAGGIWLTSLTFRELHQTHQQFNFLMIPASQFEKFLSKLFLTVIGYPMALLIFYTLFYAVVGSLAALIAGHTSIIFNPFQWNTIVALLNYIIIQAIFFLGAIYFKKLPVIKTILFIGALNIVLIIFMILVGVSIADTFSTDVVGMISQNWAFHTAPLWKSMPTLLAAFFWVALAPICWIIGYVRLKEVQA